MTVASLLRGTVGRRAFAGHGPNELGAAEAAVLRRWIVVVLACLEYSRSELRVGGENIRVRKRKRSYQFHQRWGAIQNKTANSYGIEIRIIIFVHRKGWAFGTGAASIEALCVGCAAGGLWPIEEGPGRLSLASLGFEVAPHLRQRQRFHQQTLPFVAATTPAEAHDNSASRAFRLHPPRQQRVARRQELKIIETNAAQTWRTG